MKIIKSVLIVSLLVATASAAIPEAYRKLWHDPALNERIDRNIERYRKGDASVEVVDVAGKPVSGATIELQQTGHEFLFGCNLFVLGQLATPTLNQKYEAAFINLFNFATLPFYWRDLEPQPGKPRFAADSPYIWRRPPPDRLVEWCKAHGITPKGHALMYVKSIFMPDWTSRDDSEALRQEGAKHMAGIAERYGRDIPIWDTTNEEIQRRRDPKGWPAVSDDYLASCFQEAGQVFPKSTQLLINDGTMESHSPTGEYEAMIKGLLDRGLRVGGIGFQFHLLYDLWGRDDDRGAMLSGKLLPPKQLNEVYERLGKLGLPLYITETTIPAMGEEGPALQAEIATNLYRLWFSTPRMAGVTWWNFGDGTAYETEGKLLGGLLDAEMNPKPVYRALDRLINHEWKTRVTLKADAEGRARFRGFYGSYRYLIRLGSKTIEGTLRLQSGDSNHHVIKLTASH